MLWQLQAQVPRHRYHPVPGITCACNKCPHMARNTLEKLRDCLARGGPEIGWQPGIRPRRRGPQAQPVELNWSVISSEGSFWRCGSTPVLREWVHRRGPGRERPPGDAPGGGQGSGASSDRPRPRARERQGTRCL